MRIQFYPTDSLEACLRSDAESKGLNLSALVTSVLEEYYNIEPNFPPFKELMEIIYSEVDSYIIDLEYNVEFTLFDASQTFRSIPVTYKSKTSDKRMHCGKSFNSETVKGRYKGLIKQVFLEDGTPKRTNNKNKAAIFIKVGGDK